MLRIRSVFFFVFFCCNFWFVHVKAISLLKPVILAGIIFQLHLYIFRYLHRLNQFICFFCVIHSSCKSYIIMCLVYLSHSNVFSRTRSMAPFSLRVHDTGHAATADKTAFPIAKNNVFGRQTDDRRKRKQGYRSPMCVFWGSPSFLGDRKCSFIFLKKVAPVWGMDNYFFLFFFSYFFL